MEGPTPHAMLIFLIFFMEGATSGPGTVKFIIGQSKFVAFIF